MNAEVEVTCEIGSYEGPTICFVTTAGALLEALQESCPGQGKLEHIRQAIEERLSILRAAINTATPCRLEDDRWRRTQFAIVSLFDSGKASLRQADGYLMPISELSIQDWMVGEDLCARGGKRYVNWEGKEVFRTQTWLS
jgi:hypothetical protein